MVKNPQTFKRKLLASSISTCLLASTGAVIAQEAVVEEVLVTGMRASLQQSMDQKRAASGVVDVITAEDIGKFPDTNLAEAMQRIPGVSINREGGEGSRVTVRGLGPEYNLVTHNGRVVAKTTGDRSYNFADNAAELVAGVAVSKTADASVDSGGMGATIDVKSIRPLKLDGQKTVVSAKMISDTSWAGGDTPELFALYANQFADETIGVSVAVGYQERESSLARAHIDNGWRTAQATTDLVGEVDLDTGEIIGGEVVTIADGPGSGLIMRPQSARYKFEQDSRERLNTQVVVQWAPTDNIEATLDYDHYERSVYSDRNEISSWFTFPDAATGVWATNNTVSTPAIYAETYIPVGNPDNATPNDLSMAGGHYAHKFSGDEMGLNVDWQITDRLSLEFDVAHSEASDEPDHALGSDVNLSTAAFTRTSTSIDTTSDVFNVINGGGNATAAQMQITGSVFQNFARDSEVDEFQVKGKFEFNDEHAIDFGLQSTEVYNSSRSTNVQQNGWGGVGVAGQMAAAFQGTDAYAQERFDGAIGNFAAAPTLPGGAVLADGTNLQSSAPMSHFFDWDINELQALAQSTYTTVNTGGLMGDCPDGSVSAFCSSLDWSQGTDNSTTETTTAFYLQYHFEMDALEAVVGVRRESTDVDSSGLNTLYTGANWGADTEISFTGQTSEYTAVSSDYSNTLPNVSLKYNASDDVVLRAVWSKTITRPSYNDIASRVSIDNGNFARQVGYARGSQGNPGLLPFESRNLDLSVEWYYGEDDYFAATMFSKTVTNFVASTTVTYMGRYADEMPEIHDPLAGVYTQEAIDSGISPNNGQAIRTWIFDNYDGSEGVTRDTTPGATSYAGSILGLDRDPLVRFDMSTPSNNGDDRELEGLELSLQHMFGDSGFGSQLNYTIVNSDLEWNTQIASQDQRPLLGVSDSANVIGFYENYGWNIRVAYNWRDKFLNAYNDPGGQSPEFVEAYSQVDVGISYEITDNLKLSLDGINITEEPYVLTARDGSQIARWDEYGGRYILGATYTF